ncbi:MAG: hypothetical protein H7A37_04975 [Chlamydiales bacterium]|nr:hypothetical protein [Chlamydiales bacterium]
MSTAFLRMMDNRGDFTIFHEPSQYAYDKIHYPELTKTWFLDSAPGDFEEIKQRIFEAAKSSPVFVKEVSFAVHDFLIADQEFLSNRQIHFVFLVRDPHNSIVSFYRKTQAVFEEMDDLIGMKKLQHLYQTINQKSPNKPMLISSEQLADSPNEIVRDFCEYYELEFSEAHLRWEPYDTSFDGVEKWKEIKKFDLFKHWHGSAAQSDGFHQLSTYETDEYGMPTFSEIPLEHREIIWQIYQENLFWYKLLMQKQ